MLKKIGDDGDGANNISVSLRALDKREYLVIVRNNFC